MAFSLFVSLFVFQGQEGERVILIFLSSFGLCYITARLNVHFVCFLLPFVFCVCYPPGVCAHAQGVPAWDDLGFWVVRCDPILRADAPADAKDSADVTGTDTGASMMSSTSDTAAQSSVAEGSDQPPKGAPRLQRQLTGKYDADGKVVPSGRRSNDMTNNFMDGTDLDAVRTHIPVRHEICICLHMARVCTLHAAHCNPLGWYISISPNLAQCYNAIQVPNCACFSHARWPY